MSWAPSTRNAVPDDQTQALFLEGLTQDFPYLKDREIQSYPLA